jgi:hypothetical protein
MSSFLLSISVNQIQIFMFLTLSKLVIKQIYKIGLIFQTTIAITVSPLFMTKIT